ncbi:LOW QUALITY PROTEIN: PRR25 isoform 1 [Pan troglodytes]|uniref:PRR25 isoform 1 n=1 Tax=Pan troglodytes TaxID=9598 RepID=A0A2J8J852_PANTR|nr:LOW QUALITY PROTEIN: PRR25 isoform 1 [Pan troglodytes]
MARTDQKPPCRGGYWGQPGHPNMGGAAAHPTYHPMGHRPRTCILLCGDQTTGGQAPSREISLGPWAAGTHFLAISTTPWGRKTPACISELPNSSGTAQPLANAVCEVQTVPGPGLRPQGTPATRAPSHKGTPSTPNPWGPEQPQNRHKHPKKGVTGGPSPPPPPAASRYGQTPGREPRVQAPGLGPCGRPASGRLLSLHLEKGDGKGTRQRIPLTDAAVGGDRTDIPSAIAAGRHGLPMPGSTPAPMVGSGRLGGPMGRSGGGVSARSSRPSCANVLLHADASLSTVLSVLWTGQLSRGWAVLPPGDAGRHLETSVISAGVAAGIWLVEPGEAAQDPATRRTAPPRRTASPEPPVPGAPLRPGRIPGATGFGPRSCPLGSPAVLAVTTGWSHRSV